MSRKRIVIESAQLKNEDVILVKSAIKISLIRHKNRILQLIIYDIIKSLVNHFNF